MSKKSTPPTLLLPLLLWAALMLSVSSLPGSTLPTPGFWQWDKFAHLGEYTVLAFLFYRYLHYAFARPPKATLLWAIAGVIGFGVLDELHQLLIPLRSCSALDMLADSSGALIGASVAHFFYRNRTRNR
jgi:VanZ family protein